MYVYTKYVISLVMALLTYMAMDFFTDFYYLTSLGLALTGFMFSKFFYDLGRRVDARDVIAVTSTMQWILGPALAYHYFPEHPLFYMAVDEAQYMGYVVPACFALILGLYLPFSKDRFIGTSQFEKVKEYLRDHPKMAYGFVFTGLFFTLMGSVMPKSLTFLFFLLGNIQFIGLFMLFLTPNAHFKWPIFFGVMSLLFGSAILQGMFYELLLWLTFLFLIFAAQFEFRFFTKALLFIGGIFLILVLQSVKEDYRKQTWYKTELEQKKQQVFRDVFIDRLTNPSALIEEEVMNNTNARLNQGWIIARILKHVPENEPFAAGETVKKAFQAALLPRIFVPDKAVAGGKENFERFTGTPLNKNTSMDLSLAGEAYANFGLDGGLVFLFCIGLFFNAAILIIIRLSRKHPTLLLCIPLIFFQVIKAETDFATVLNHLTKAVVVVFLVYWMINKVFNVEI